MGSVAILTLIKKEYGLLMAGFWSLWTTTMLFFPPLILIQLLSAWLPYMAIAIFKENDKRVRQQESQITTLEQALKAVRVSPSIKDSVYEVAAHSHWKVIEDDEHYSELIATRVQRGRGVQASWAPRIAGILARLTSSAHAPA